MNKTLENIRIAQLRAYLGGRYNVNLDDDFILTEIFSEGGEDFMRHPLRFDGYMGLFCIEGSFTLEINMSTYKVQPNSFLVSLPGYITRVAEVDRDAGPIHLVMVAMSSEFVANIMIDLTSLWGEGMKVLSSPVIVLDQTENKLCKEYLDLELEVLSSGLPDKKRVLSPLIASMMQLLCQIWQGKISSAKIHQTTTVSSREKIVFEQFLKLVTEYHMSERGMAFYAERMRLTPKYLSKIVKKASGRSAPDWIDSFVILEAKNMLKYSDASIKEIVYKLNFVNQSVFYKFFKNHTGMTPSEYRNS